MYSYQEGTSCSKGLPLAPGNTLDQRLKRADLPRSFTVDTPPKEQRTIRSFAVCTKWESAFCGSVDLSIPGFQHKQFQRGRRTCTQCGWENRDLCRRCCRIQLPGGRPEYQAYRQRG